MFVRAAPDDRSRDLRAAHRDGRAVSDGRSRDARVGGRGGDVDRLPFDSRNATPR